MHPHRLCLLPTDQAHKRGEICHKDETCSEGFLCDNRSRCIKPRQFCNGHFECKDGTDEIYQRYYTNQTRNGVICRQKKYFRHRCLLPVDQANKKAILCDEDDTCSDGFACADGQECIEALKYCHMDTYGICKDGSHDTLYNASLHTDADGIPCRSNDVYICLLPANQVFKKKKLCIGDVTCSDAFLCSSGDRCIEPWQFCNGVEDCSDGGDEVSYNEWNHDATDGIPCRNVGAKHVCLLPCDQARKKSLRKVCAAGKAPFAKSFFTCFDGMGKALPTRQLCDEMIQCNDFTDECLCEFGTGLSSHPACDKITWEPDSPCGVMFPCNENNGAKCLNATKICNKMPDCEDSKDEDRCPNTTSIESHPRTTKKACKMQGSVTRVPEDHMHCDGKYNCDDKSDEKKCRHRFYCTNEQPVNIPMEFKCDTVKDCEDWSDELDCTHSKRRCKGKEGYHRATMLCETHFYCNDGGERVVISSRKVCDGNTDCFSGADECEPWCIDSAFSSVYSLLDQPAITPFIWTISLVALIGNIGVASFTGKSIIRPKFELSPHQMAQKILVLNLAVADFLVGVYTMSVCVQNVLTKGQYCLVDQLWRSGTACSVLGAILVIGSEESVFALTIITSFRLKAVVRPFASTSAKLIWFCMIASWSIALMVGFIPLAPSAKDYFRESMWYSENPLFSTLPWEDVRNLSKRLIAYQNQTSDYVEDHGGLGSWSLLEKLIANLNPEFIPARTFGYYSAHGVCLPRLFPDREKIAAWSYSLGIIIFNFISFLFILIAYIFIYKLATKSNIRKTSNVARATSLQRKVTRIVITDFLCWMPICIMVIMQVSGVDIHPDVYIPVGTILIPINSALNPFLYSDAPEWCWKKIRIMRSWLARAFAPLCAQDVKVEPQEVEDLRVIEDGNQERIKIHAASRKAKKKKTSGNEAHTMVTLTKCTSESKHD